MGRAEKDSPFGGIPAQASADQPSRDEELERALSEGATSQLPPNQPKGLLGEVAPNIRQAEDFSPDLNSGISQETDAPVILLGIVLAYILFFPLAFLIVWRTRVLTRRAKIVLTALMALGVLAVGWLLTVQ